jgi:predicted TIM-barrel fold metal-dependent hydrolase
MSELPIDIGGNNLRAWLAQTTEQVIDADQPIIDPHHHLWDRRPRPEIPEGTRTHIRYLADDLIEDIRGAGHNVFDTVFIECGSMYRQNDDARRVTGETEFVQGVAAMAASGLYGDDVRCCGAIVGFTNLTRGAQEVEMVLRAHMAAGANFRGIRHAHGWHESPDISNSHHPTRDIKGLLGRPEFREGFKVLDQLNLSFDCWGFHTQLAEVGELANAFPEVTIILNHIGGPMARGPYEGQRAGRVFQDWRQAVEPLAACRNIVVKLGGLGMPTYGFGHEVLNSPPGSQQLAKDWQPYFDVLINAFSPARCMFESNFPVDKVSCSYLSMWNAFKIIAADMGVSDTEKNDLFYGTAARAYRMSLSDARNSLISTPAPHGN